MRNLLSLFVIALASACVAQVEPNAPWPLERQDRWGTGKALVGPPNTSFVAPYVAAVLSSGSVVSHGASIMDTGVGYYGDWQPGTLYEFDTSTNAILRSLKVDPNYTFVTSVPALGLNDACFVGTDSGYVSEIDRTTMTVRWSYPTTYIGGSVNIGPDGDIVATTASHLYRWQKGTGAVVWSYPTVTQGKGTVVFSRSDNRVFFADGNNVSAIRYSDGQLIWTYNTGSPAGNPAVAPNGTVVFGCDAGTIFAVAPGDGHLKWTVATAGEVRAAPGFDDNVAYVGSYDGKMYAIRVNSGVVKWSYQSSLWCNTPPSIGENGRIYFHNKGGDLYCLNKDGTLRWQMNLGGESRGPLTIGPDATLYVGFAGNFSSGMAVVRQLP